MSRLVLGAVLAIGVVLAGCSSGSVTPSPSGPATPVGTATAPAPAVELTVFAAASLKDVLDEVKVAYEAAVPAVTLVVATDSSATLRTQIEQGAPADVFLSADTKNPQALVDGGLATRAAAPFAGNTLTVIVPVANPAGIASPADLAGPGVKIIAAGDDVPITTYAAESVTRLAALDGYPADFAAAYAANVVSREDNVTAIVTKVELGEGDAGIVYTTDARSAEVSTVPIPPEAQVVATYAGIVVAGSARAEEGTAFLDWLVGPEGQAILGSFGFVSPAR